MVTVVDVLSRAARQCSVKQPSNWLTASEESYNELRDDFLLETVADILDRVDLPSPIGAQAVITGDGSETYNLPSSFRRLHRGAFAVYETTNQRRPCIPVTDDGQWTHIKQIGSTGADRYYRMTGYEGNWQISLYNVPTAGISITVSYNSENWASLSGTGKSAFTDAADVLLLPREVVECGIVYRYRERRGLPYQDKRLEYEAKIARLSNDARSRRTVDFSGNMSNRKPWEIPVPDFIPSS